MLVANGHATDTGVTVTLNETRTITYGDRSITAHNAGREVIEIVEGESLEEPHTQLEVVTGLRGQLKVPGGGLVQSDAGNLQFLATFDEHGDIVNFQIVKGRRPPRGGHERRLLQRRPRPPRHFGIVGPEFPQPLRG